MQNPPPPPLPHRRPPPLPMPVFALAALTPVPLIGLGALAGGAWLWAGFLYMALLSVLLDQLIPYVAGDAAEGQEFPGADLLLAGLALSAMSLLLVVSWTIAAPSGRSSGQKILLFCATGLWLGQVGHPAAHELIHRGNRLLFRLGQAFYIAILFGQHASAHRLVHHRYVASDCDPNTAREGESFYHFARRAWIGSWKMGWRAETDLRARARGRPGLHPYAVYLAGGALCLGLALVTGGVYGLVIWILLGLYAQMQVLVSDYVQHYGLRRARLENGRLEPVGPQHSWNTAPWASSALMLNAPRHSDHHSHPSRPYPALRLPAGDIAPRLPWPLPLACCLAFLPGPWRRLMRPHLRRWQAGGTAPPGPASPGLTSPGPTSPQVRQS